LSDISTNIEKLEINSFNFPKLTSKFVRGNRIFLIYEKGEQLVDGIIDATGKTLSDCHINTKQITFIGECEIINQDFLFLGVRPKTGTFVLTKDNKIIEGKQSALNPITEDELIFVETGSEKFLHLKYKDLV
jgi:hypothetical protein